MEMCDHDIGNHKGLTQGGLHMNMDSLAVC